MDEIIRWEYKVQTVGSTFRRPTDEELESTLDELGEEGWKVVEILTFENSGKLTVVCRRPQTSSSRRRRSMPA